MRILPFVDTRRKWGHRMKLPYKEGNWIAIPLKQGGFAIGRIARADKEGGILVYFFGPRRDTVPTVAEVETLAADRATGILRSGDLGLLDGTWRVIGDSANWDRNAWPVPLFLRKTELLDDRFAWLVAYSDDAAREVGEKAVPFDTTGYPEDGLCGSEAAEMIISRTISEASRVLRERKPRGKVPKGKSQKKKG